MPVYPGALASLRCPTFRPGPKQCKPKYQSRSGKVTCPKKMFAELSVPRNPLEITAEDREKLRMIAHRPKSAQAMAMRAHIVLSCDQGMSNAEVARKLHVTGATVGKWRERFRQLGLDGLLDEPRVGAPRKITDRQIEEVVTKTLESMPANSTHWSTRLMAEQTGLTQNAIVRIWHAFGLQPHRVENFKFSTDPQFVEKVRDIVGLYLNPPDRAIILCVDEKSQVQALNQTEPILPLAPGVPARQSHDYERCGVTSLFAAMDVASGVTISNCYRRRRHQEFLRFLNEMVERLFAEVTERCVRRGSHTAVRVLEKAMLDYLDRRNENPKPFVWTADADLILGKVERLRKRISRSGH
jgi:transposase